MAADRRILTPIAATLVAGAIVGAATLGGTMAGNPSAAAFKTDRFAMVSDELCEGQSWPNLTPECLAWKEGETSEARVRFVTFSETDSDGGLTTLNRSREIVAN